MAQFLTHHQNMVDEMVILDTGSTDDTVKIAKAHGAKVFTFEWCDDFSLAKNFCLGKASGDWVFSLDIDELVDPSDFEKVRKITQGDPACCLLPQWNYYSDSRHQEWQPVLGRYPEMERNHTGFFVAHQYRLFANGHGLKWDGCVHEDLSQSLKESGLLGISPDIPFHHYGYVMNAQRNTGRNETYGRLVRKKVQNNPADMKAKLELAYILVQENQGRDAMPVLEVIQNQCEKGPILSRARTMLAQLYTADNRPDEAIMILHQAVTDDPNWVFGWKDLIHLLIENEHWEQVEMGLQTTKDLFGENPLLLKQECTFLIKTRRIVEAIPVARRLAQLTPAMAEYAGIADKCEALARKEGLI